jgi:hypothetical protein
MNTFIEHHILSCVLWYSSCYLFNEFYLYDVLHDREARLSLAGHRTHYSRGE